MEDFKVGDIVHLKTGSLKMIIIHLNDDIQNAQVLWHPFGTNEIKRDNVPYIALRKHT